MTRYLTPGMLVLVDGHRDSRVAALATLNGAERPYVLTPDGKEPPVTGFREVIGPGRGRMGVPAAFRGAVSLGINWIAMRRSLAEPQALLGECLEQTARNATDELPGFGVLMFPETARPIRRMLVILDRTDGSPSGLLLLAAVTVAERTGPRSTCW